MGGNKGKFSNESQMITNLYKDKFIDEKVLWNLLGSRFKKSEIEQIDETFRKCKGKGEANHRGLNE